MYRNLEYSLKTGGEDIKGELGVKLGVNEVKIMELITKNKFVTIVQMAEILGISTTAVGGNILKLKKKEILRRNGSDKSGHWEVVEK